MHLLPQNIGAHHQRTTQQLRTPKNMSFLKGVLGNKAADSFVDQAVDKVAVAAKKKVKETITGKKQETDKTGGMGGLFPSSGEKDKKPKEKEGGGLFGGLLSTENPGGATSGGATSGGVTSGGVTSGGDSNAENTAADSSFNDALDDLANEFGEK